MAGAALAAALGQVGQVPLERLSVIAARLWGPRVQRRAGPQPARVGNGLEFLDFHDYQSGDEPRRLDWRASARAARPVVRRYRESHASDWYVLLDQSASMAVPDPAKWLLAAQLTAAHLRLLLDLGQRVGLGLFAGEVLAWQQAAGGPGRYLESLGLLLSHPPGAGGRGSRPGACAPRLPDGASVILVSDFLVPGAMLADLAALQARGGRVQALCVHAGTDARLPGPGARTLEDAETGIRLELQDPPPAAAARERLAALHAELAGFCRRRGIPLTFARADEAWAGVVLRHLRGVPARRA